MREVTKRSTISAEIIVGHEIDFRFCRTHSLEEIAKAGFFFPREVAALRSKVKLCADLTLGFFMAAIEEFSWEENDRRMIRLGFSRFEIELGNKCVRPEIALLEDAIEYYTLAARVAYTLTEGKFSLTESNHIMMLSGMPRSVIEVVNRRIRKLGGPQMSPKEVVLATAADRIRPVTVRPGVVKFVIA